MRGLKKYSFHLLVLALPMLGCSHQIGPQNAAQDTNTGALTNYGNELIHAQDKFDGELSASHEEPLPFVVEKLSQEPSIQCHEYAEALHRVLTSFEIPVANFDGSPSNGNPLDPFEEARIDALTHLLLASLPDDDSGRMADLRWQMLTTVAKQCPTGGIFDVLFHLPPGTEQKPRRDEICRMVFSRLLDDKRPPSASVVSNLLAIRLAGLEAVSIYSDTLNNPKGSELSDLLRQVDRQINRQMDIDRKTIELHLKQSSYQASQVRKSVEVLDRNLATLQEDKRRLNDFFDALWKNDAAKVTESVNGDLSQKWVQMRRILFMANAKSFQVVSIDPSAYGPDIAVTLKVNYPDKFLYEQFSLIIDRTHGWHLSKVLGIGDLEG